MDPKSSSDYLEEIGWGKYNKKVFIQCGVVRNIQAWTTEMIWEANIAYIMEGSKAEFNLGGIEAGALGSFYTLGLTLGTTLWGMVGDRYGRMYAFKTTVCLTALFSLILVFAVNQYMMDVCLFFIGIGAGGELALGGTVFYEFCPPSKAYYLTRMGVFWGLGGSLSALIALITIMTNKTSISTWRFIVASTFLIELFCAYYRFYLQETPAYCESSGQITKMELILNSVSRSNNHCDLIFDINLKNEGIIESPKRNPNSWALVKELYKHHLKKVFIFGVVFGK